MSSISSAEILRESLCSGAVVQFVVCFCSDGRVWGAWAGAGVQRQPGGLSQRQLTAWGAEHAPRGSA